MKTIQLKKQIIKTAIKDRMAVQQLFELGLISNIEKYKQDQQIEQDKQRSIKLLFSN